eukprot:TRINITY_DN7673_c0_g1_i1.p1 TRINITY_DN7673_c0_g1~~TRINITY_DN7673_c0_g1_i1.p1  ORF type:complete len:211 (+),score=52.19 TRINITY_DN7673_c0_g1_i1:103-735(+)
MGASASIFQFKKEDEEIVEEEKPQEQRDALSMMILREKDNEKRAREQRRQSIEAARRMSQQANRPMHPNRRRSFASGVDFTKIDERPGLAPLFETAVLSFGFLPRQMLTPITPATLVPLTEENLGKLDEQNKTSHDEIEAYQRRRCLLLEYVNEPTDPHPIVWDISNTDHGRSVMDRASPDPILPPSSSTYVATHHSLPATSSVLSVEGE